jgi:hypothetical protein
MAWLILLGLTSRLLAMRRESLSKALFVLVADRSILAATPPQRQPAQR